MTTEVAVELPQPGDRIELLSMPHDPFPVQTGEQGVVRQVVKLFREQTQISVEWDSGRKLSLVTPPDEYRIIERMID